MGLAGLFGAPLVGWMVVVAHGLYLARHLFTFLVIIVIVDIVVIVVIVVM